ncbi:hypothetical protein DFH27DRAFT_1438 [Peziza echinospora]|nr:hypothetical protein DFH27DRAFT_1438 [Peziza echinospora]
MIMCLFTFLYFLLFNFNYLMRMMACHVHVAHSFTHVHSFLPLSLTHFLPTTRQRPNPSPPHSPPSHSTRPVAAGSGVGVLGDRATPFIDRAVALLACECSFAGV